MGIIALNFANGNTALYKSWEMSEKSCKGQTMELFGNAGDDVASLGQYETG